MGNFSPDILGDTTLVLKHGGVIAYPTEGVFGFGCDPFNKKAVEKLLEIKQREANKGLIVIGSSWEQLENLVNPISSIALAHVFETWPGPVTWVFPASTLTPKWIRGDHPSIAVRIPGHTLAREICKAFGGPVVSSSANIEGFPATRNIETLKMLFEKKVDYIVPGEVGSRINPSEIRDAISGEILRNG